MPSTPEDAPWRVGDYARDEDGAVWRCVGSFGTLMTWAPTSADESYTPIVWSVEDRGPLHPIGTTTPPVDEPWRWLESTRRLQEVAYGDRRWPKEGEELADSVMMNATAMIAELGEVLNELGWKPWASPRGWVNRDAFVRELVDVGHFLGNMLVAVGVTDLEWEMAYRSKQQTNLERQLEGYTGRNKCPRCKRAYDDVTTRCRPARQEYGPFCADARAYVEPETGRTRAEIEEHTNERTS